MKTLTNVQGSQPTVPPLEINVDTVYIRTNIKDIHTTEQPVLWQYDEVQLNMEEYLKQQVQKFNSQIEYMAIMSGNMEVLDV